MNEKSFDPLSDWGRKAAVATKKEFIKLISDGLEKYNSRIHSDDLER